MPKPKITHKQRPRRLRAHYWSIITRRWETRKPLVRKLVKRYQFGWRSLLVHDLEFKDLIGKPVEGTPYTIFWSDTLADYHDIYLENLFELRALGTIGCICGLLIGIWFYSMTYVLDHFIWGTLISISSLPVPLLLVSVLQHRSSRIKYVNRRRKELANKLGTKV
jgi:hypothetical protein